MVQTRGRRREYKDWGYYDPEEEHDPLIRKHIRQRPPGSGKNDPIIIGVSGHAYPAWSVYLQYLAAKRDTARAAEEEYGNDLTAEQIKAAVRFAKAYPDLVMPYVEPHLESA